MKKTHFIVVCTFGAGSSLMLKMNVDAALKEMGISSATVEVSDMGSYKSKTPTAFMCSVVLKDNLQAQVPDSTVIGIKNFYNKEELKQALMPYVTKE